MNDSESSMKGDTVSSSASVQAISLEAGRVARDEHSSSSPKSTSC